MSSKETKSAAAKADTINTQELKPIEELRKKHKTGRAVFAGACAVNGWKPGKVMSDEDYVAGVAKFTKGPTNGPKTQESEAKK